MSKRYYWDGYGLTSYAGIIAEILYDHTVTHVIPEGRYYGTEWELVVKYYQRASDCMISGDSTGYREWIEEIRSLAPSLVLFGTDEEHRFYMEELQ